MPHAVVSDRQRNRAKQLRQTMTPAETLLWRHLKANRMDGIGFRRQTPIKNYIVDFVCFSANLIIEIDGESHNFAERQKADERRDAFFVAEGFRVLRFTNEEVMSNLEGVVAAIREATSVGASGLPPSLTLPHKGGGNGETAPEIPVNTNKNRGTQP
ncbi:endonuclease domain-containing protein [Bradyrhizobium jicamae]|uniref:endonuclease domain-containing protein n=1 Tax=Bradyrhizobium jicamae TaxID=280332 RepID=UPI001BA4EF55|nr:endonuclease domain-containing protein [Bradyrhizobium jicamae]MBR0755786.1 endonuclease domain-containing protein [Bradyrhizobium jicamae]